MEGGMGRGGIWGSGVIWLGPFVCEELSQISLGWGGGGDTGDSGALGGQVEVM